MRTFKDSKKGVAILTNDGLGDHIIMNGAIRRYMYLNPDIHTIRLICKEKNFNSMCYLYRHEPRVAIMTVRNHWSSDPKRGKRYWRNDLENQNAKTEFPLLNWNSRRMKTNPNICWVKQVFDYTLPQDIPHSTTYTDFFVHRDEELENIIYEEILHKNGLKNGDKYIFACCEWQFGTSEPMKEALTLRAKNTSLPIVYSSIRDSSMSDVLSPVGPGIFAWLKVIEEASEIHTLDTSFLHLIKRMKLINKPKFFWDYRESYNNKTHEEYLNNEHNSGWERITEKD